MRFQRLLLSVVISDVLLFLQQSNAASDTNLNLSQDQQRLQKVSLYQRLMGNYTRSVIPASTNCPSNAKTCPLTIQIRMFLIRIQDLVENGETLISTVRLQIGWVDSGLTWNASDFGGISSIVIPGGNIWTPDLQLANSVDNMYSLLTNNQFGFRLTENGQIWWHPTDKIQTRCSMDLSDYPFDYQRCAIVVESVIYTTQELNMIMRTDKPNPVSLSMYTENQLWNLIDVTGYPVLYQTGPNTVFSRVHFWMLLKRVPDYYGQVFIIPIALLSVLQVCTYLIPFHYVDRTAQATVVLLAAFVLEAYVAEKLPRSSQQSLVQTYLNVVIGIGVATVGISVVTIELVDPDEGLHWWGMALLRCRSKMKERSHIPNGNVSAVADVKESSVRQEKKKKLKAASKIAALLNFFGFAACLLITIVYPCIAFVGTTSLSPPKLPPPPPNNITTSYYAEFGK